MLTGCQKDRTTCRKTDGQKEDKTTFQPSIISKQKLFRMSTGCQKDRKIGGQNNSQLTSSEIGQKNKKNSSV